MLRVLYLVLFILPSVTFGQAGDAIPLWKIKFDSAQFFWKVNSARSVLFLKDAERIAFHDLGIYDENYLTILNDLGLAYSQVKDFQNAQHYLNQSLKIQNELYSADDVHILQVKCNLATITLKSGDDHKAKPIYQDVMTRSHGSANTYVVAANHLAGIYEAHDQLDSALIIVRSALLTSLTEVSRNNKNELYLAEGRILRKMKRYEEATHVLNVLNQPASEAADLFPLVNAVRVEMNLIDIEMGLYGKAEKEMLQIYRTLKASASQDEALLTELTNGLAYLYEKLGIYDKSLVYYQESLSRCVSAYGYSSLSCLIIQNNIAGVYLKQGLIGEALQEYERFIKLYSHYVPEDNSTYLIALNNLATAYRQNGQYEVALEYFNKVYRQIEAKKEFTDDLAAMVMNNIAVTHTLQGNYSQAIDYFEKVLKIKKAIYGEQSLALLDVTGNLAVAYWISHRYQQAIPLFQQSLLLARKQVKYIFPNLTEAEQVQFYQQQKENFERFNTLSVQSAIQQDELLVNMFNNQLLLKSLAFFTNKKRNHLAQQGNSPFKNLVELAQAKTVQLGHLYQLPLNDVKSLHMMPSQLEDEIDSLEKLIRLSLPQQERQEAATDWNTIQQSLSAEEALIDIVRFRKYDVLADKSGIHSKQISIGFTDSVYYAALITSKETTKAPIFVLLKNGNGIEGRYLSYYRNALKFDIADTLSYHQFWQPIEQKIQGKHKLYISADGVFHKINLNAIRDQEGKFILEKYDLHSVLNSAQLVNDRRKHDFNFSRMVLMGDPTFNLQPTGNREVINQQSGYESLPASREEIKGIINALKVNPSNAQVFIKQEANESNLRNVVSPSVLHIATHGFFSADFVYLNDQAKNNFLFHSGLILSAGQKNGERSNAFDHDGIITAYDIMDLDLSNTELVVLSACETGLGKVENSEGVYGLQRSFMQAGASDVLISLWKVEDVMTKDLMVKFYSYLGQQIPRREALKKAQLDLLHQVGNPRQWAAFVMIGSD